MLKHNWLLLEFHPSGPSKQLPAATGTLKLHWKAAQAEPPPVPTLKNKGTFWNKVGRLFLSFRMILVEFHEVLNR